jgi:transcriptional regulator with XRE-family HTH domain
MAKEVNQFGLLCRKMRLEKKLTMTDFAKKVGASQPSVSDYEIGKHEPPFEYIVACMDAFGLSPDERIPFLTTALSSFKKMTIRLDNVPDFQKRLLAILLLTERAPETHPKCWDTMKGWIDKYLEKLGERPRFTSLSP